MGSSLVVTGSFGLAGAVVKVSVIIIEFTRETRYATSDLDTF